jgi:vanillate O-demethylase monooxygenase subunit
MSTHYFWSLCRNYRVDDEGLTGQLREALRRTFDEDKSMLELQQRAVAEAASSIPGLTLRLDNAPIRARQMLELLLRREREETGAVIDAIALIPESGSRLVVHAS